MRERSITIIDHEINNLASITNAFRALGANVTIAHRGEDLHGASHVVLPGVGAYGPSMAALHAKGFVEAMHQHAAAGNPLFGICLGFQALFERGTEGGSHEGLGFFPGSVDHFETSLHVPHVGWNSLSIQQDHPLFSGIEDGQHVYFVHSYHPRGVTDANVLARSEYGEPFVCMVADGNVAGAQFHPEKSGAHGLKMLLNFLDWRP